MPTTREWWDDLAGCGVMADVEDPRPTSIARWIVGALLGAMALGQVLDVGGFRDALVAYDAIPAGATWLLALGLIAGEAVAAVGLLTGRAHRRPVPSGIALAVALVWTALGVQAFARGIALDNCGCFGVYLAQPLRWWVLLEDAELVFLAALVVRRSRSAAAANRPAGPVSAEAAGIDDPPTVHPHTDHAVG